MKAYRLILSLMASVAAGPAFSQTTGVVCEEFDQIQLTHVLTPTGPLPTALDPNGVHGYYPVSISWPGGSRSVSRSPTLPRKMSRCFIRSIIRETAHM